MINKEKLRKFLMERNAKANSDIAKEVLSNENYNFEFLEDGTRIQIVED